LPIEDAATAIQLADRACHESWGKLAERNGQKWYVDPNFWHARIVGDHWKVWTRDESRPDLSINVPRNGTPPDPGSCDYRFDD